MDNGGEMALFYSAIIVVFITVVIYPAIITSVIVLIIKIFKRKLCKRNLLLLWVIIFVIVTIALRWVLSPSFPTNRERLIKMPDQLTTRSY